MTLGGACIIGHCNGVILKKEGNLMKNERSYSAKSILIALGKSALYLLFFLAVQFFVVVIYGIVVAALSLIHI